MQAGEYTDKHTDCTELGLFLAVYSNFQAHIRLSLKPAITVCGDFKKNLLGWTRLLFSDKFPVANN